MEATDFPLQILVADKPIVGGGIPERGKEKLEFLEKEKEG
jgi:hypothetical protein